MLVLTRKVDESILIGDDIKITLVRIEGGRVRVGIDAPKSVRILRGELEKTVSESKQDGEPSSISSHSVEAPAETYDDVAAVFAHPEANQVRTGRHRAPSLGLAGRVKAYKEAKIAVENKLATNKQLPHQGESMSA